MPAATPAVWEVVSFNKIPSGEIWKTAADWPSVFPGLWAGPLAAIEGATIAGLQGQWVRETADPTARFYVEPKPARGPAPGFQDLLSATLTARGRLALPTKGAAGETGSVADIELGRRWGHDLIVGAFDSLASSEAKKAWERGDD